VTNSRSVWGLSVPDATPKIPGVLRLDTAMSSLRDRSWRFRVLGGVPSVAAAVLIFLLPIPDARGAQCVGEQTVTLAKSPSLSGQPAVGSTLRTSDGQWRTCRSSGITSIRYQWVADGRAIFGATASSYVVTQDDAGATIHAIVTASDDSSSLSADSDSVTVPGVTAPVGPTGDPTADETTPDQPASATPVDGSGGTGLAAAATTYTTDVWSADDVDNASGLHVISSTATGTFALTGVVLDQAGGTPVSGATVTLSNVCSGCSDLSATTNATGAFAFINVPASTPPTLAVAAGGFGSYTVSNFGASPDEQYATTVGLTTAAQSYDDSTQPADGTATAASASSGYASDGRVPPFITVAEFPQAIDCSAQSSSYVTRRYSWRFYVLHTMQGEIGADFGPANGGFFHQQASKAVAAAIQNYAWYARQHSNAAGGADIDNTTRYQCFMPHKIVRQAFHTWLEDVLDERIATSSNTIQQTFYKAGGYSCAESAYPANGNDLSQFGAKARDETCGVTDWRTLDNYYYTGSVT
jgi:hypothetical protein